MGLAVYACCVLLLQDLACNSCMVLSGCADHMCSTAMAYVGRLCVRVYHLLVWFHVVCTVSHIIAVSACVLAVLPYRLPAQCAASR
jgi:hypothetical protein